MKDMVISDVVDDFISPPGKYPESFVFIIFIISVLRMGGQEGGYLENIEDF
jgi:hypothetical protein